MAETGENVAEEFGISRQDQDALAYRSQQRAGVASGNIVGIVGFTHWFVSPLLAVRLANRLLVPVNTSRRLAPACSVRRVRKNSPSLWNFPGLRFSSIFPWPVSIDLRRLGLVRLWGESTEYRKHPACAKKASVSVPNSGLAKRLDR
jgi:hypothetical protein